MSKVGAERVWGEAGQLWSMEAGAPGGRMGAALQPGNAAEGTEVRLPAKRS